MASSHLPPDFTLRQLSYFVAAAEAGTITGAARAMHVSNSAMSDAITELERIIGEPLCVRRQSKGLVLTPAGAEVVRRARQVIDDASDIPTIVRSGGDALSGPLAVACYPTLAPQLLPIILHDFGSKHPDVDITIVDTDHEHLEEQLESGRVDVAFSYDVLVPGTPHRRELYRIEPHVLLAEAHPLSSREAVNLEELRRDDLIVFDAPPSSMNTMAIFGSTGFRPRIRYKSSSFEVVRTLVGRGLGYSILFQRPRIDVTYEGRPVRAVGIEPAVDEVAVDVIWSNTRRPSRRVEALVAFVASLDW